MRNRTKGLSKGLVMALIASLLIFLSGCGTQTNNTAKSGNSAADVKKGEFVIKVASPSAPDDSCVQSYYKFKDLVESKSNGRIQVQVFPNGQLGDQANYIAQMQAGNIQIGEVTTSLLAPLDGEFGVFDLPYIAKSMDSEINVLKSGMGDKMSKNLENNAGLKIVGWLVRSPRSVYSSKGPIKTADDFKGLKIRVMQSPIMVKTMELLGAQPVPISANERYMALQTHVVDAAENSVPLIITQKEYEVTKYVSLTEHFLTPNVMAMDAKFFNKLPADLQKIVSDSGKEAADYEVQVEKQQLNDAIKTLESKGMKVNSISDKSSFIEKVRPIYAAYQDKIGKDVIDAFLSAK
ncbi:MAG: TRAP transporter substrate-binding protein [Desulfitobacteriaceae bacterium]